MLGKQWNSETPEVKAYYKTLADCTKKKHAEEYPGYHYAPRKPSEKRRRPIRQADGQEEVNYANLSPDSLSSGTAGDSPESHITSVPIGASTIEIADITGNEEKGVNIPFAPYEITPVVSLGDLETLVKQVQSTQGKTLLD